MILDHNMSDAIYEDLDLQSVLTGNWKKGERPPLWDGKTAARAVACLRERVQSQVRNEM